MALVGAPGSHAAATAGTVVTWGSNTYGQLGDGTVTPHHTPQAIAALPSVVQIEGGREHGLARTVDGSVYAWGWNRVRTGGHQLDRLPGAVAGPRPDRRRGHRRRALLVVRGEGGRHPVGVGMNAQGQLGDGTTTTRRKPVQVIGLASETVVQVSGGRDHTMARTDDGTVYTWGSNAYGQLGNGTHAARTTPAVVPGVANVIDVMAGRDHCLAVSANGSVWAWGRNGLGQLGNGNVAKHPSPVRVKTKAGGTNVVLSSIVSVGAGADHSLALAGDGTLYAWGANRLGPGRRWLEDHAVGRGEDRDAGSGRRHGRRPAKLHRRHRHGSGLHLGGRDGQLGDGSTTSSGRTTPGIVPGLTADAVAMGRDFAFAIVPAG